MQESATRRSFLQAVGHTAAAMRLQELVRGEEEPIQGFEEAPTAPDVSQGWKPVSEHRPLVGIADALNMTVAGIVAHQSVLKNGELTKIPQYGVQSTRRAEME